MFARKTISLIILLILMTTLSPLSAQGESSLLVENYDSTLAREWMLEVYGLVRDNIVNAPAASRIYAYTSVALYEGLVNGMPTNFSISGQIPSLPPPALSRRGFGL